jgi:uridylate kinase
MARTNPVVVNVGGSIVAPESIDTGFLTEISKVLSRSAEGSGMLLVVGGGRTARRYIDACRELGASEEQLDLVGIEATRLNARLLITAVGPLAFQDVPVSVEQALEASVEHPIVVMGGTRPGQTTDAVSAQLAKQGGAEELLILTNVDGVYTADPREDPSAERLQRLTTAQLVAIVSGVDYRAGSTAVVDPLAARIIHEADIRTKVLDGRDLAQVEAALTGDDFVGTLVQNPA